MTDPTPPRHVLHVSQPVDGGVGVGVLGLVRAQGEVGWPVTVACPPGPGLAETCAAVGATVVRWDATRQPGPGVVHELLALRRIVADADPDLVHLHSAKAGLVGRLLMRGGRPTVYSPHGWSFHAAGGPLRSAVLAFERTAGRRWSDRVLCVSEDERRTGAGAGIRAAWDVVDNGVDTEEFRSGPEARSRARAELGVQAEVPLAVCVGRLSEAKGQDRLLAAWPTVRRAVPTARLVLVGDGPLLDGLAAGVPAGVTFVGSAPPHLWYAAADVVVAPSRWEGMALAPLEAMATGRSLVAFDVDGLPRVLREHGAVVTQGAVEELGRQVVRRLQSADLRGAEEEANLAEVRLRYDVTRATDETMAVYDRVLEARGGRDD